jgi:hypothetical protein
MSWWKYAGGLSPGPAAIPNLANPSGLAARLLRTRPARRGCAGAQWPVNHASGVVPRPAEGQRGGANAGLQPGRIQVVGLPAEGRAQAVERIGQVPGLGSARGGSHR